MTALRLLLNIAWLLLGGLVMAIGWFIASAIMAISIIGLPWARAAFNIAAFTLLPFGQEAVSRADYTGKPDLGAGWLGTLGNIIWLVFAGWWLALLHIMFSVASFVSIIGIPFAWAHIKLARLALWPIGRSVVSISNFRQMQARLGS